MSDTVGPAYESPTVTAEAKLVDVAPIPTDDRPHLMLLPQKIEATYWPGPDGWQRASVMIVGRAVLKSGEISRTRRCAYYYAGFNGRPGNLADCPAWAREFADLYCPTDGARWAS